MLGFEPRISDVGSDSSANCATTTALMLLNFVCANGYTWLYHSPGLSLQKKGNQT